MSLALDPVLVSLSLNTLISVIRLEPIVLKGSWKYSVLGEIVGSQCPPNGIVWFEGMNVIFILLYARVSCDLFEVRGGGEKGSLSSAESVPHPAKWDLRYGMTSSWRTYSCKRGEYVKKGWVVKWRRRILFLKCTVYICSIQNRR